MACTRGAQTHAPMGPPALCRSFFQAACCCCISRALPRKASTAPADYRRQKVDKGFIVTCLL